MDILSSLSQQVDAAVQELDHAVAFHETWKPTVYDQQLLERVGTSAAADTFAVIRTSLRREMLMALMRLWDSRRDALRLDDIVDRVCKKETATALVAGRTASIPDSNLAQILSTQISAAIISGSEEAKQIIAKWRPGGANAALFEQLKTLRSEVLAHRSKQPKGPGAVTPQDADIEAFYSDNIRLVQLLSGIVKGVAYNPNDTASIFEHHANAFWSRVGC